MLRILLSAMRSVAAVGLIAFSASVALAQDADPVVAKVNGTEIRQSDVALAEQAASQLPPMSAEQKRDYIIELLANMILVSQAAEEKKLGETASFKRRLAFARHRLLMGDYLNDIAKSAQTEEALRKIYDEAKKESPPEPEVHARHILIQAKPGDDAAGKAAEAKIKAVIERLKKGDDFVKVANETTEDPSGKTTGGDLGFFSKEQMVPEFADVAFKLEPGKISDPVKTSFGWHVIKVEEKRTRPFPAFEEVKSELEAAVANKAHTEAIQKLRESAKIERLDKPAAPKQ